MTAWGKPSGDASSRTIAPSAPRRPSLRRLALRTALGVAASLGVAGVSGEAAAAPSYLRLSYTGDTATTMSITWNTTDPAGTEVKYGTAPGNLTQAVTGTSLQANAGLGHVHEVTLTGLQPGTKYYYTAGSASDGFTAESSFTTGLVTRPDCGKFKFAYLGDNRPDPTLGAGENWPEILGQSTLQQPAFVLNGGDLVIDGDQIDQWHDFLGWTSSVAATLPFLPSIGNHDTGPGQGDGANYNQLFALPRSTGTHGSGTEDYYYFRYGNAIFVALSTEGFKTGAIPFADQAAWLDEVLTNNPARWKIVFYHKPSYTHEVLFSISHAGNEEGQNAAWTPIFEKHHVDVVFTSHNHWYERFEPSACATQGKPGSSEACSVGANNYGAGTVYYVSGGAGAFTIPGILCGSESGRANCSGSHHYIVADIADEVMRLDTWGAYPQNNQIIDSITIAKNAVDCTEPPDAGPPDASTPPDAGPPDAPAEAGPGPDASTPPDAGPPPDGSTPVPDSSVPDGAVADSGAPQPDSGTPTGPSATPAASSDSGCGCRTAHAPSSNAALLLALGAAVGLLRRRRDRRDA